MQWKAVIFDCATSRSNEYFFLDDDLMYRSITETTKTRGKVKLLTSKPVANDTRVWSFEDGTIVVASPVLVEQAPTGL
jgi:hypothetical protein